MLKFNPIAILFFSLILNFSLNSQTLVKDFNQGKGDAVDSWGTDFLQIKDRIFISVKTSDKIVDLYVIKNEEAQFVANLCNNCSLANGTFVEYKDKLVFSNQKDGVISLWITEGSPESTKLLTTLENDVDNFKVGRNNLLYILTNNRLFVSDGTATGTKMLNSTSFKIASHYNNNDDVILSNFNNGVAFLLNNSGSAKLMYADTSIQELASFEVGSSFTDIFGLYELEDGLVFIVEDEGLFHFTKSNGLIKTTIEEPLRLIGFKGQVVYYKYGKGLSLLHGNPLKSTFLIKKYGSVIQDASLSKAIIGDQMLIHIDDYNSFDDLIIKIDKSTKSAIDLGEVESYPSNFIQYNDNVFFAAGTSNGFSPHFYHLKGDFTSLDKFHSFNFDSNDGPSIIPIGVQNKSVFYISNADPNIGRELYKISADVNTSIENTNSIHEPKAIIVNNTLKLDYIEKSKNFDVTIYNCNGMVLGNRTMDCNSEWSTDFRNMLGIVSIKDKDNGINYVSIKYFD